MYAIAGVSGHTGSIVAATLLAQRKQVRVIVRDAAKGDAWRAKGAEVAVAPLDDAAAVARALTGVEGAYLLLPPDLGAATPIEDNAKRSALLAGAVRAAKVPHVVLLSSVGAQHATGTGPIKALHRAELDFAASGTALTALRASSFQDNWGMSLGMLAQGILPTFVPASFAYAQVASEDIGRVAAAALVEGSRGGKQVIELGGPREYSAADVAAVLAELTGKPVAIAEAPLDAVVPTFTGFGISAPVAKEFQELYAGIGSGRINWEGGSARNLRGSIEIADTLKRLLAK